MSPHPASLNEQLAVVLNKGGDAPALIADGEVISYAQLKSRVASTAARLRALSISKGDHVAFQLPNCAEAVILMLATLITGAAPAPLLPAYREQELRHILKLVRPRVIAMTKGNRRFSAAGVASTVSREEGLDVVLGLIDEPDNGDNSDWLGLREFCSSSCDNASAHELRATEMGPEDTAMMLLSSGTTGLPKPIARKNAGYSYMIGEASRVFELSHCSSYLAVLPISHGFVINCPGILGTLLCGGAVVLSPDTSAETALRLITNHEVTHSTLVPALLAQWLDRVSQQESAPQTLRHIQVGGSRLPADLAALAESKLGMRIQQCYGMSEGLLCFTRATDSDSVRFNSQGRPLSEQDEVLIVDEDGTPVPLGQSGELITRGPYTISSYFNNPLATSRAFTQDGYYRTGDMAHLDSAGNVYIDGRLTDSINRGGEKFSPEEIEALTKQHAKIQDVAVVGISDQRFGEVPCLFAVVHEGEQLSLSEVRRHLEIVGIAQFKLPERLVLIDAIPRKGIGKIDRASLRAQLYGERKSEAQASGSGEL